MKNGTYIIENDFLKKTLVLKGDKIVSFEIFNKLSSKNIPGGEGSEEFVIFIGKGFFAKVIKASALKIDKTEEIESERLKSYKINFRSIRVKDSKIRISLIYDVPKHQGIFRKHIEISFDKVGKKKLMLDYADLEQLHFDGSLRCWSIPQQKNSHVPGYSLEIGQPIYIDSIFMGCEFPGTLNRIESFTTQLRYYSGRDLRDLASSGKFVSCNAVAGAAEGNIFEQVQRAFFEYIKTISRPCPLRRQYNSWYDHMLNITRENVYGSFLEIEKGLTKAGEKPLDSYVVDDGWNDYSKGFWGFNDKFPDELYPFSSLAQSFGSDFGLWIGPRGGYTTDTIKFAKHIQRAGNGYVNAQSLDICVASDKYVRNISELMLSYQEKFSLNYWKLDGFAQKPCRNRRHGHMTGGYHHMYFYTDLWEKWIKVFKALNEKGGNNYWLNFTSYAPPTPWFLQYVNSIWIQISTDVGFIGKKGLVSDKDRMLSYRDEVYFDFYKNRQFQFPQRCLYNHDPIFGNEAKVSLDDNEFRDYLFTMAMRGTSFWELYYSYNMMNEAKWRINYSVMRFMQDNLDVLSNSVVFGARPSAGQVYGFSGFEKLEGIVALRNSSDKPQEYTLRLDETIGVSKELLFANMTVILPYKGKTFDDSYSYGDSVKISLAPYQTKILHFGRRRKEIQAEYVTVTGENTLEVTFNQFINPEAISCKENGIIRLELLEDYMSILITFEKPFDRINNLTLCDVGDIINGKQDISLSFDYYPGFLVTEGFYGKGGFTISATLDGEEPCVLMRQGEELSLYVGDDGRVHFKAGFSHIVSRSTVSDKVEVTVVREKTGVIKIYLDKTLDNGMYCNIADLSGEKAAVYNQGKVRLYNKAFAYDEI